MEVMVEWHSNISTQTKSPQTGGVEETRGGGQGGGGVNRKIPSIFHLMNFLIELPLPRQIHYGRQRVD